MASAVGVVLLVGSAIAADVSVGVTISGEVAPGVYGRVDIGSRPPPPVLYPQPVIIVKSAEYEPGYQHPGKGRGKGPGKGRE